MKGKRASGPVGEGLCCCCWTVTGRLGVTAITWGPGKNSRKAGPHWSPKDPEMWRLVLGFQRPGRTPRGSAEGKVFPAVLALLPSSAPQFTEAPRALQAGMALPLQAHPWWPETLPGGQTAPSGHSMQSPPGAHGDPNPGQALQPPVPAPPPPGPAHQARLS